MRIAMDDVAVITCRTTLVLVQYTSNDAILTIWVVYLIDWTCLLEGVLIDV